MRYTALDSWSEGQKTILRFFQVSFSLLSVVSCQNWPFNWSQISIAIQLVPKEMSTCLCSGRPGSLLAAYQPLPWSGNSYTKQRKSLEWGPWWLQVSHRRLNKRLVHRCFRFWKGTTTKFHRLLSLSLLHQALRQCSSPLVINLCCNRLWPLLGSLLDWWTPSGRWAFGKNKQTNLTF